jgi:2-oxoisovalerate ferredoxin oxidoreductase alpha subunit
VLADGFIGQMMEPVEFPERAIAPKLPTWAVAGTAESRANLVSSIYLGCDELEAHVRELEAKYRRVERNEARAEDWYAGGAEIVLVGYGIVGRILKAVTSEARASGLNVGLLRPITLYPFPVADFQKLAARARVFAVVEMSNGQLVDDVRLALNGARPVEFLGRGGGNVPTHHEVLSLVKKLAKQYCPALEPEELAHV